MRVGIFSDTHLYNWRNFSGLSSKEGDVSKRLAEQIKAIKDASIIFREQKVDYTVFGGDWVHSVGVVQNEVLNVSQDVVKLFDNLLVVDGNHDTPVRVNPKQVHIFTNIIRTLSGNGRVPKNIKLISFYDEVDYDVVKGYDLVVLHKTPYGSKVGNYVFEEGVDWKKLSENNKFVVFGHIHETQILGPGCFVIGAPYHLTFGDVGERGVWIIDTETCGTLFCRLDAPQFITVQDVTEIKDDRNYYRVLSSTEKIEKENVISVVKPKVFEERIKSDSFYSILDEWLVLNNKDKGYLDVVKDLIEEKLQKAHSVFKGKLREVRIENFGSVKNASYKVKNGFTLVTGNTDNFDSNGSGKTTLLGESIFWALFGSTTKELTGDDVIMRGEKDCRVELDLVGRESEVTVRRTRKDGLEIQLFDKGMEVPIPKGMKQTDIQKYFEEEILGFDKNTFLSSCYFSQENLVMLTGLSDLDKTNMITNLLGFECYENLYLSVRERQSKFENEVRSLDLLAMGIERKKELEESKVDMYKRSEDEAREELSSIDIKIDNECSKKEDLKKQLTVVDATVIDKTDYKVLWNESVEKEEELTDKLKELSANVDKFTSEKAEATSEMRVADSEIGHRKNEIRKLTLEISNLESLKRGVRCDKCGAIVSDENIGLFVNEKKDAIRNLETEQNKFTLFIEKQSETIKKCDVEILKFVSEKNKTVSSISEVKRQLQDIKYKEVKQLEESKRVESQRVSLLAQIDSCDRMIKSYAESKNSLVKKIEKIGQDIVEVNKNVLTIQTELEKVNSDKVRITENIDICEFWKVAFSAKGIRAVLLDRFCNEFNSSVNIYLSQVSNGSMGITLTPTKTMKSGEERNKIGMVIGLESREVDYRSLSGGEKRRVDASLCFGLNNWIGKKYGIEYGLLGVIVCDEVFAFLDKAGEESIAQLLSEEGQNKAVFVIDHALTLDAYADRVWRVVKRKGISELEIY